MAVYTPPTENIPIFDNLAFPSSDNTALTVANGRNYFLTYPVAQGEEIFPSNITLQSTITDSTGSKGINTQILSSTGTGTQWVYSGSNAYIAYTLAELPFDLPTTTYSNLYLYFSGNVGAGRILTIPITGFTVGTLLTIKNISYGTLNLSSTFLLFTAATTSTSLYPVSAARMVSFFSMVQVGFKQQF